MKDILGVPSLACAAISGADGRAAPLCCSSPPQACAVSHRLLAPATLGVPSLVCRAISRMDGCGV